MTDHEHEPQHPQPEEPATPERRPGPRDDLDPALLETALDAMRHYAESGRRYGVAFIAYFDLESTPDSDDPDFDEEADFRDRYIGHYTDRGSFIRDRIAAKGWDAALAAFEAEQGMWPGDVTWDEGVLWEHLGDLYGLVERLGGVYAFRI